MASLLYFHLLRSACIGAIEAECHTCNRVSIYDPPTMKRLRVLLLSLLVAACVAAVVRYLWEQHTERKQEAAYQAALRTYSNAIQLGTSRRDLETYFRLRATPFHRQRIQEQDAYADLTKIGEGDHPWYCKRKSVYVAFQFNSTEKRPDSTGQSPLDTLKQITLFPQLEGCR